MDVHLLFNWVIVICGSLIIISLILAIILGILLYRQFKTLTSSIKETASTAKQMGSDVGQAVKFSKDIWTILRPPKVPCENQPADSEPKK
jgi:hypothetical protein